MLQVGGDCYSAKLLKDYAYLLGSRAMRFGSPPPARFGCGI
jgi:hypothetical protein